MNIDTEIIVAFIGMFGALAVALFRLFSDRGTITESTIKAAQIIMESREEDNVKLRTRNQDLIEENTNFVIRNRELEEEIFLLRRGISILNAQLEDHDIKPKFQLIAEERKED